MDTPTQSPTDIALQQARAEAADAQLDVEAAEFEVLLDSLNYRQRAFVREYVKDENATQAARRAGYNGKAVGIQAHVLLNLAKIRHAVDVLKAQRVAAVGVSQESILHEMNLLATSCLENYVLSDEGQVTPAPGAPEGVMGALQSIKRKVRVHYNADGDIDGRTYDVEMKLWDKPTPLKLMGRHIGLFPDKIEVTGKDGKDLEVKEIRVRIVGMKDVDNE